MTSGYLSKMATAVALASGVLGMCPAHADLPYIGEVISVPFTFCPSGWAEANGSLLPISEYDALFALYGTTYGGDGSSTFGLPDLRGRAPVHVGTGPGLPSNVLGEVGGAESFTLTTSQMPSHTHAVNATSVAADKPGPLNKYLAADSNQFSKYSFGPSDIAMASGMLGSSGGSQPVGKLDPYLAIRYCVSLFGVFPSLN